MGTFKGNSEMKRSLHGLTVLAILAIMELASGEDQTGVNNPAETYFVPQKRLMGLSKALIEAKSSSGLRAETQGNRKDQISQKKPRFLIPFPFLPSNKFHSDSQQIYDSLAGIWFKRSNPANKGFLKL